MVNVTQLEKDTILVCYERKSHPLIGDTRLCRFQNKACPTNNCHVPLIGDTSLCRFQNEARLANNCRAPLVGDTGLWRFQNEARPTNNSGHPSLGTLSLYTFQNGACTANNCQHPSLETLACVDSTTRLAPQTTAGHTSLLMHNFDKHCGEGHVFLFNVMS